MGAGASAWLAFAAAAGDRVDVPRGTATGATGPAAMRRGAHLRLRCSAPRSRAGDGLVGTAPADGVAGGDAHPSRGGALAAGEDPACLGLAMDGRAGGAWRPAAGPLLSTTPASRSPQLRSVASVEAAPRVGGRVRGRAVRRDPRGRGDERGRWRPARRFHVERRAQPARCGGGEAPVRSRARRRPPPRRRPYVPRRHPAPSRAPSTARPRQVDSAARIAGTGPAASRGRRGRCGGPTRSGARPAQGPGVSEAAGSRSRSARTAPRRWSRHPSARDRGRRRPVTVSARRRSDGRSASAPRATRSARSCPVRGPRAGGDDRT
jgi:hypothetical protein